METAQSLITDAFAEILLQPNEQPIQSVDFQTGIRYLNRMMNAWAASGLNLGYTIVAKASDPITVPDGAIDGMIKNLALSLGPQFDMPISPDLRKSASDGLKAIRRIAVKQRTTLYPCTLPIGSGNEKDQGYGDYHYYPCPDEEILTEREGAILLESNTDAE